ncbi:MAG: hypothetical protein VCD34_10155 [Planctomycetota bacterium]
MQLQRTTTWAAFLATAIACSATAEEKAPSLGGLFPAGCSRSETVTVTALGNFSTWPPRAWILDESENTTRVTCRVLEEKGKLEISAPEDAEPGIYWLRLYNAAGASSPRPFLVSTLPGILEKNAGSQAGDPLRLKNTGVMVHGRLEKKGEVDKIAINLETGAVLVADLLASRVLASPMDASLQVTSPAGFILAENDDDQGVDPRIVFRAPAQGLYIVRIFSFPAKPNSTIQFAGENSYVYRLALTTGPFIEYAYPLAAGLSGSRQLTLNGWNIPADRKLARTSAVKERTQGTIRIPGGANRVPITREDGDIVTEEKYPRTGKLLKPSGTLLLSGRTGSPGEKDVFLLTSSEKRKLSVSVKARELGSLLDPVLSIKDPDSKTVSEADDTDGGLDCKTEFTAAGGKTYQIEITDRYSHGGQRFYYLLRVATPEKGFSLALGSDSFVLENGMKLEIPVTITRHGGFDRKILVTATDLPDGIRSTTAESVPGQDSAKAVKLILEGTAAPLGIPFRITGKTGEKEDPMETAGYKVAGRKRPLQRAWLTVKGK